MNQLFVCTVCQAKIISFATFYCQAKEIYNLQKCIAYDPCEDWNDIIEEDSSYEVVKIPHGENYASEHNEKSKLKKGSEEMEPISDNQTITDEDILRYCSLGCELCEYQFEKLTDLFGHYSSRHQKEAFVNCCELSFNEEFLFRKHIREHLDSDALKCTECQKTFNSPPSLKSHRRQAHPSGAKKQFLCDRCPAKFVSHIQLKLHVTTHKNCKTKEKRCAICQKQFKSNQSLNNHRNDHFFKTSVQCMECGKWLKNIHSLRRHMVRHSQKSLIISCKICGKQSPNEHALSKHIQDKHTAEKNHKCLVCKKGFKRAFALKEHMSIHTGQYNYRCDLCGKMFKFSANLSSHRKKDHSQLDVKYKEKDNNACSDLTYFESLQSIPILQ
ncbi:zinc finger protein 723-like [Uranotaenia lowii]|uniref:zinc finger protein 723-like n=1 Tax=Uranotaenia lowii TaxID=190385 RepID=UPI002479A86E|nr:zinc finger protein 723-like [Uranotaenia lowii]XP_055598404.1 zinc finger protein 723-like [Uranotaenia lowii]